MINESKKSHKFYNKNHKLKIDEIKKVNIEKMVCRNGEPNIKLINFIKKCLTVDRKRPTLEELITDDFFC